MIDILLDTPNLLAVSKPPSLATIPGRAEPTNVLEELGRQLALPTSGAIDPRLRLVHRLDKDTTGVLLFAKNIETQRHLSHQFQNNTIEKEYLALVVGRPRETSGEIDAPLAPHPNNPKLMIVTKHGRPARSLWQLEEPFRDLSLLRIFPKTGKTHQIRVHLKHIGHPLAIDPLYNPPPPAKPPGLFLSQLKPNYRPTRGEEERPLISRLTLHAEKLRFTGPTGEPIEITAPLPKDFRATLSQLRKLSSR